MAGRGRTSKSDNCAKFSVRHVRLLTGRSAAKEVVSTPPLHFDAQFDRADLCERTKGTALRRTIFRIFHSLHAATQLRELHTKDKINVHPCGNPISSQAGEMCRLRTKTHTMATGHDATTDKQISTKHSRPWNLGTHQTMPHVQSFTVVRWWTFSLLLAQRHMSVSLNSLLRAKPS